MELTIATEATGGAGGGRIRIRRERVTAEEYIDFLKRTDLGSQYPKERFRKGIATALMKQAHALSGGKKDIAVYLIANDSAVPFYETLGMKRADEVIKSNHIEWTDFTVGVP